LRYTIFTRFARFIRLRFLCSQLFFGFAEYSVHILESVYSKKQEDFTESDVQNLVKSVKDASERTYTSSFESRKKDYTDSFRTMTYDSKEEMISVLGSLEENAFLNTLKNDVDSFNQETEEIFGGFGS